MPRTADKRVAGYAPCEGTDYEALFAEPQTTRFNARVDMGCPIDSGQRTEVYFDAEWLYLFDSDTSLALDVEPSEPGLSAVQAVPPASSPA